MRRYEINIDINKLLHYSDTWISNIDNKTLLLMIKSFALYVRDLYISMIEDQIESHRYKGEWEPISEEGYLEFIGTTPSTQSINHLIKDALEIRKSKNSIVIRFDPKYKYPNSDLSLLLVLKAIDNGTSKFNARPMLKSIIHQLNTNILPLWRKYLIEKGVI